MTHPATHVLGSESHSLRSRLIRVFDRARLRVARARAALRKVDQPTAMLIFAIAVALLVVYFLSVTPISRRH
jgi:hypothetical protein